MKILRNELEEFKDIVRLLEGFDNNMEESLAGSKARKKAKELQNKIDTIFITDCSKFVRGVYKQQRGLVVGVELIEEFQAAYEYKISDIEGYCKHLTGLYKLKLRKEVA